MNVYVNLFESSISFLNMSRNTSKKYEEVMREFIDIYKENECIWKLKSKDYTNKSLKEEAHKKLVEKLTEVDSNAKKEDVIKKINSLLSCFRKEFKKVTDSKKSGSGFEQVYKPNLWYYELLLFLKDQEIPRESVGFDTPHFFEDTSDVSFVFRLYEGANVCFFFRVNQMGIVMIHKHLSPYLLAIHPISSAKRRRNAKENDNTESLITLVTEKLKKTEEDEFDIIGKNVAEKLRKLPTNIKLFSEKIINDCLFEAQLGTLNRHAYIEIPQQAQSYICPSENFTLTNLQQQRQTSDVTNYINNFQG
ncbi:uncharacterized protein [Onthophagus taurus]|uniref:uncharacterized protein n=1 Tax=Onthophagus taurus TaxID=166361 RepID=UPI0039BE8908